MTQGERVKVIRKSLGLTLEKFGDKLGITKSSVSRIEAGIINLTEQMAKAICRTYNVNYLWLTKGIGDMFIEENNLIKLVAKEYSLSDLEEKIVTNFVKMPPNKREIMVNAFKELFENK